MSKKRQSFSPEFREEAAKIVIEQSRPVAREIGVNEQTLCNWVNVCRRAHPPANTSPVDGAKASLQPELQRNGRDC